MEINGKKLALVVFTIIIVVVLVLLILCEFDRNKNRKVIPTPKMYYFPINIITGPTNVIMKRSVLDKRDFSPFPDIERNFPQHTLLKSNWMRIRDEVLSLYDGEGMKTIKGDLFFNKIIPDGNTWKKFYIKWHSDVLPDAQNKLPFTSALIASLPCVKICMISVLTPGAVILPHLGPTTTCARYHLCLQEGGPLCYIMVDGIRYSWKDGEDVLFDDTYVHEVRNNSKNTRIIMFCDVERQYQGTFSQIIKNLTMHFSKKTTRGN